MWLPLRLLTSYPVIQHLWKSCPSKRLLCFLILFNDLMCVQFLLSDGCTFILLHRLLYIFSSAYLLVKGGVITCWSHYLADLEPNVCFNFILKFTVRLFPSSTERPMTEIGNLVYVLCLGLQLFPSAINYLEGKCISAFLFFFGWLRLAFMRRRDAYRRLSFKQSDSDSNPAFTPLSSGQRF